MWKHFRKSPARKPLVITMPLDKLWYCPRCFKFLCKQTLVKRFPKRCRRCKQRIDWTDIMATDAENFDVRR